MTKRRMPLGIFAATLALGHAAVVKADESSALDNAAQIEAGRAMAEKYCSGCHAVGATGKSAHDGAPEFRTLSSRYPLSDLEEALAEGITVGHPDMPQFEFDPSQSDDLIAYLRSIQDAPEKSAKP